MRGDGELAAASRIGAGGRQTGRSGRTLLPGLALACCLAAGAAAAQTGARDAGIDPLRLTIEEAIFLALKSSRAAVRIRLQRDEQKLSLEQAEERYRPDAGDVAVGVSGGSDRDRTTDVSLGPSLRVPTGGTFRLRWSKPVEGPGDRASTAGLTFTQPLLKGFGPEIDTASLRRRRMQERIDILAFRDGAAGVVSSVIGAYRGVLSARRRVVVAREALERARRQLEINQALVDAGRLAARDLVQSEASVADRQYALIDSENALDTANSELVNVLDLEEGARIEPSEEPAIAPERPNLEKSLETAFANRTDWLRAELGLEFARMDLRLAENNALPDLSMNLGTTRRGGNRAETDYSWRLNLTVPLWDFEPRRALVRAKNDVRRARMERAETRQSIRLQVRQAVHNVSVALRRIELAGRARELAESKIEVERLKLQQGLSSAFQLGRFEDDLVNAQRREIDAVAGYRNSLDSLGRTLGATLDRWGIEVEQVGR